MVPATAEEEDGAAPWAPDSGDKHAAVVTDPPDVGWQPAAHTPTAARRSARTR
jgi:hypothetical protein